MSETIGTSSSRHGYIAAAAIVWNLIGLSMFVLRVSKSGEQVAALSPQDRAMYDATPTWLLVVFGAAVITGMVGAIGLWRRQRWAGPVLGASLGAATVQMIGTYLVTPAWQASGPAGLVLPALILGLGAAQWRYASRL
jgi:hypothetical protein